MRDADERRNASIITHSSTRCLIDRRQVGCTMKTSVPRMFSSIWNETSVSGKRSSLALPDLHAAGSRRSPAPVPDAHCRRKPSAASHAPYVVTAVGLVGAEGFEPSNTGSKVPRLTAWPRPIENSAAALSSALPQPCMPGMRRPDAAQRGRGIDKCSRWQRFRASGPRISRITTATDSADNTDAGPTGLPPTVSSSRRASSAPSPFPPRC